MRKSAALASLFVHASVILALLLIAVQPAPVKRAGEPQRNVTRLEAPRRKASGGGQLDPLPASKGGVVRTAPRPWLPPFIARNPDPKLAVEPALVEAPDIQISAPNWGDPLAPLGPPSGAMGRFGGIGYGEKGGVGDERGPRLGGLELRLTARITVAPQVIYKEEPEYSEEARKARWQGTVVLAIVIDPGGQAREIRVVRGLGLGLDEKAVEAVRRWRFRPAQAGGKPVPAPATIEVNFRLL